MSASVSPSALRVGNSHNASDDETLKIWSTGKVLSLMDSDAERVQMAIAECSGLFTVTIIICFATGYDYWLIGWPSFVMIASVVTSIPLASVRHKLN